MFWMIRSNGFVSSYRHFFRAAIKPGLKRWRTIPVANMVPRNNPRNTHPRTQSTRPAQRKNIAIVTTKNPKVRIVLATEDRLPGAADGPGQAWEALDIAQVSRSARPK